MPQKDDVGSGLKIRTGFGVGPEGVVSHSTMIVEECVRLRKLIQPIADRTYFQHNYDHNHTFLPNPNSVHTNTLLPFCLVLGNHSSGKSSFINYVLGRKVQTAGVAPTDDSFTIIIPGNEDMDKNGPALVGDPDLGFEGKL